MGCLIALDMESSEQTVMSFEQVGRRAEQTTGSIEQAEGWENSPIVLRSTASQLYLDSGGSLERPTPQLSDHATASEVLCCIAEYSWYYSIIRALKIK